MSYQHHLATQDARADAPCIGRFEWISDDRTDQASARLGCESCPAAVFAWCKGQADADTPAAGTWAGVTYGMPTHDRKEVDRPDLRKVSYETLAASYVAGLTTHEVATKHGVSPATVNRALQVTGTQARPIGRPKGSAA